MSHTVEDKVRLYVKMRDALSAKTKEYEDYKRDIKAKMARVEGALLAQLNDDGAESIRTTAGTVFRRNTLRATIADFTSLRAYIMETGNLDLLQKRVSTEALRQLGEDGALPEIPGISTEYVAEVSVRRAE